MINWIRALGLVAAAALLTPATSLRAQDDGDTDAERIESLENEVNELRDAYGDLLDLATRLQAQLDALSADSDAVVDEYYIPRTANEFQDQGFMDSLGGIYTKPFLAEAGKNTYLGGYIDLEYADPGSGGGDKFFDQHRFVPFIYSDVSDNVKVAAEIEYEHGHELEVEFAQMDFLIDEAVNLRAGIQLIPLGRLNFVHDTPVQDLTFRPLVNQYIVPTTLRDAGLGVWGDLSDTVSYTATVTNGFRGLDAAGTNGITTTTGLKNAAPHKDTVGGPFDNINDDLAYAARVAWQPELGVEMGVSGLHDKYDENADNHLKIYALDATVDGKAVPFLPDNVEFLYEAAWADIDRDGFARASGVAGDMRGYYAQANVHFEPDFLASWRDKGLGDRDAHFTLVARYDHVNLDTYDARRKTLGINYRPNASQTVIKLDYLFNDDHGSPTDVGFNDDNTWALSFASYF